MEKSEKQRKKKIGLAFYTRVIEKMGNEVITTNQLYTIVDEVEEEMQLDHEQSRRLRTAKKLEEILGDFIVIADDPKAKFHGRQKPKTYLVSENWRNGIAGKKASRARKMAHRTPSPEKKLKKLNEWMQQVYSMLILANNANHEFRLADLNEGLKTNISGTTLENEWVSKAKEYGIELDIKKSSFGKRNATFKVCNKNLNSAFASLNMAYKKYFKESLPSIGFHMGFKGPGQNIQKKEERTTVEIKPADEKNIMPLIYYIAALIRHEGKTLAITDIAKTLSRREKTYFAENILSAIKPAGNLFRLSSHKDYLGLDGETAWLTIQDKYNPKKFVKYEVLARIGLPQKSLKKFGVNAEVVSEISENDNIYRIKVSYSEADFLGIVRLMDYIDLQQEIGRPDKILTNDDDFINEVKIVRGDVNASYASGNRYFRLELEK